MKRRKYRRRTIRSAQPRDDEQELEYKQVLFHHWLLAFLILVVTIILLSLIFIGGATWWVVTAVIIILVVLMLGVIGTPHLLPKILREISRILRL